MLTVKPKYCFRPNRRKVSISKGFGLFQHYNLSLHFTLTDASDIETSLYR